MSAAQAKATALEAAKQAAKAAKTAAWVGPPSKQPTPSMKQALAYLRQHEDAPFKLDPSITRLKFLVGRVFNSTRGQSTLRHRFLPSTTLPPTDPPTFTPKGSPPGTLVPSTLSYADFTLRHLAWNHPTVPFDFAIRNNVLPEEVKEVEKGEFVDEKARAASELKLREDKLDLEWVNQSEFVDVYTDNASTPSRRIDITPVPTHQLASMLPSLTSPSAKPTGDAVIPLGEGPELWKWVLQTRPRPANFADRVQALEEAKRRLKERKEKKAAEQ